MTILPRLGIAVLMVGFIVELCWLAGVAQVLAGAAK